MKEYTLSLDYYELLNLHKALLEAKFNSDPDNELVSGSPLVAGVYIQVRDLLMQSDKSDDWKAWFQLKNRPDRRKSAIIRILGDERWEKASDDDKKKIAGNYDWCEKEYHSSGSRTLSVCNDKPGDNKKIRGISDRGRLSFA